MLRQPKPVPLPVDWTDDDFDEETSTVCPACNGSTLANQIPTDVRWRQLSHNTRLVRCTFCEGQGTVPISKACTTSGFRKAVVDGRKW